MNLMRPYPLQSTLKYDNISLMPVLDYQTPPQRKPSRLPKIALIISISANACCLAAIGFYIFPSFQHSNICSPALTTSFFWVPLFLLSFILAFLGFILATTALVRRLRFALSIPALLLSLPILILFWYIIALSLMR